MADQPLTVDQLIATLQAVRERYGGDVPVVMCDEEPVVKAGVVWYCPMPERMRAALAGVDDPPKRPHCIVTDRHEDDGGQWSGNEGRRVEVLNPNCAGGLSWRSPTANPFAVPSPQLAHQALRQPHPARRAPSALSIAWRRSWALW